MKSLLQQWQAFLNEGEKSPVVTFDFDDTLLKTRYDEDWGIVEDGPKEDIISQLYTSKANGYIIYIVTSRFQEPSDKHYPAGHPAHRTDVQAFVSKHSLPVDGIFFTNGNFKADTLIKLGSIKHFDDDPEEINTIKLKAPEIETVLVPASW